MNESISFETDPVEATRWLLRQNWCGEGRSVQVLKEELGVAELEIEMLESYEELIEMVARGLAADFRQN